MFETPTIIAIVATFFLAGTVKGVIGLGLPTVSLALLTVAIDLPSAMALLLVPSFVTNLWQALVGGHLKAALGRIWPFLFMATVTVWLGALALTRVDLSWLSALLGALLIVYAAFSLAGLRLAVTARQEAWTGPLAGAANGILTGMTGSFVVPRVSKGYLTWRRPIAPASCKILRSAPHTSTPCLRVSLTSWSVSLRGCRTKKLPPWNGRCS